MYHIQNTRPIHLIVRVPKNNTNDINCENAITSESLKCAKQENARTIVRYQCENL